MHDEKLVISVVFIVAIDLVKHELMIAMQGY